METFDEVLNNINAKLTRRAKVRARVRCNWICRKWL